jgi:hypothetical protein
MINKARDALVIWGIHSSGNWILPLRNEEEIPARSPFYHWLGPLLLSMTGRVNELTARLLPQFRDTRCASWGEFQQIFTIVFFELSTSFWLRIPEKLLKLII